MADVFHRVRSSEAGAYALRVHFGDGTNQVIDFEPVLGGELFGPLRDPTLFGQVAIDPEAGTLVWPNGADLDNGMLDGTPGSYAPALARQTQDWERAIV